MTLRSLTAARGTLREPSVGRALWREWPVNGSLRSELLAMFAEDQAAVSAFLADAESHRRRYEQAQVLVSDTPWPYVLLEWSPLEDAPASARRVVDVVRAHTARLRGIVSEHGWPGRSLVGEDGA